MTPHLFKSDAPLFQKLNFEAVFKMPFFVPLFVDMVDPVMVLETWILDYGINIFNYIRNLKSIDIPQLLIPNIMASAKESAKGMEICLLVASAT